MQSQSDMAESSLSFKYEQLKQLLRTDTRVKNYVQKLIRMSEVFGAQALFDHFQDESLQKSIHLQRLILHKVLNLIASTEDCSVTLQLMDFLVIWVSLKIKFWFSNEEVSQGIHKPDKDNWSSFRARLYIEVSSVNQKFPYNFNLSRLSKNLISLSTKLLNEQAYQFGTDLKEELEKVIDFQKDRIRVETNELPKVEGFDSYLKVLESLSMQLSQIQSVDIQVKHFYKNLQPVFIQVCQALSSSFNERKSKGITEFEDEDEEKEILSCIAKILEILISPTEYMIKMKGLKNQDQVFIYWDKEYKAFLQRKCKKLYKSFAFGINALITRVSSYKLQASCLRLLKRYYEVFASHQKILEDTIITCLQNFAEMENVKKHKIGALFLYYLINSFETSDAFKKKLKESKELEILKFNPHFSSVFYVHQVDHDPQNLNDLHIKSGFQLEQVIQPKVNFKQYLVVKQPNSIFHYNFTTQQYNIGFSVERVGQLKLAQGGWEELNNEEVVRYSICDSHLKPISGSVLIPQTGVYKAVWHNSYSYLKAKVLKYRLRILEKKDAGYEDRMQMEQQHLQLDDLFIVNDLSEKEDQTFKALKSIYPEFLPFVKLNRPKNDPVRQNEQNQALVLMIEEKRSYLKICMDTQVNERRKASEVLEATDTYVQQINQKQIEQMEFDAAQFYSSESNFTEVYILTRMKQYSQSSVKRGDSIFSQNHKKQLKEYIVKAEKILYYTLEKTNFHQKLNNQAEFYFSDVSDTLIASDIYNSQSDPKQNQKQSCIYASPDYSLLLLMDQEKEFYQVSDISNLNYFSKLGMQSMLSTSQDSATEIYQLQKEFFTMVFSYLKINYNIDPHEIIIYEDDTNIELIEIDDQLLAFREEALRLAPLIKTIHHLFRKGQAQNN